MVKAGYTAVAEFHYLHHDVNGTRYEPADEMSARIVQAAEDAGIGLTLLPVLYTFSGFGEQPARNEQSRFVHDTDSYIRLVSQLHTQYAKSPSVRLGIALHSLRAVGSAQMTDVLQAITQLEPDAPV